MTLGAAHALPALLLEHPDFRSARRALDDPHDTGVGHERSAGEDFAAVFFDEEDLTDRELRPRRARRPVDGEDAAWGYLVLTSAGLDDCVHVHLCKLIVYRPRPSAVKPLSGRRPCFPDSVPRRVGRPWHCR